MPNFYNQYSPQTGIGQGLNNAISSLFSGKGPKDEALDAAHLDAYNASAAASRAHAAKFNAEAESDTAGLNARKNFLEDALKLIPGVGVEGLGGVQSYLNTGDTPREAFTNPGDVGPTGVHDAPWFTPGTRRNVDTTAQLASLLMAAKPSNIEEMAKAREALAGGVDQAGVLEGSISPTRFAQSRGKPVSDIKDGYLFNQADENTQPTELGIASALIGERDARANLDEERMSTEEARQRELNTRAHTNRTATKLVPVTDENGDTIWMPVNEAAGEKVGTKPGAAKTKKPLTKSQNEQMAAAVAAHESELDASLDANTKASVTSKATQYVADPESEFYQDPAGAVQAAFNDVGELDVSGRWNPFKSNVATAKRSGAPAVGAPPGPQAGEVPTIKSQKDYDALQPGARYLGPDGQPRIKQAQTKGPTPTPKAPAAPIEQPVRGPVPPDSRKQLSDAYYEASAAYTNAIGALDKVVGTPNGTPAAIARMQKEVDRLKAISDAAWSKLQ